MTPEPNTKPSPISEARRIEMIKVYTGHPHYWGWEEIARKLNLTRDEVRPYVIGGPLK
jgi:hypothetical protein